MRNDDRLFMSRCLELARNGIYTAAPNPMVGAVIVHRGRVIGEGWHQRCGEAHAEVNAYASVSAADRPLLREATLYVSLEPCAHYGKTPPCAEMIIREGIGSVVVGCVDSFAKVQGRGIQMLREAGIPVTVLNDERCRHLNRHFFTFHEKHRPWITLKWAQTANGFIDDNYRPATISTPFTTMLCHKLRAEHRAILVGRVTAERDKPQLNVRQWTGPDPLRLVLSRATETLPELMERLSSLNIQSLLVEGGAATHASFLAAGLWDEIRVETSPVVFANGTRAPQLPEGLTVVSRRRYDSNTITILSRAKG